MQYISDSELCTYIWATWEESLISILNSMASWMINSYLRIDWIITATYTNEEYDYQWSWVYYLKQLNPTALTHVDWVAYTWSYKLEWRKLTFQYSPALADTIYWKIDFTYTAGFTAVPDDFRFVVCNLVWYLYNNRKSSGIKSFTQGQISVAYWGTDLQDSITKSILQGFSRYKKNDIYSK